MRSLIPGCLAAVCAVAVLAGPAEAQRGRQGGGSYNRGYSGYNYGNYRGNNYGNNYGYYRGNNYGYYGGNSFGISVGNQGYYNGYGYRSYPSYSYYGGYNTPQYGYGYNATPYYVTPGTSDAIAYNSVPSQSAVTTSNYGDPLDNAQAWLRVILPDPNSRLTIEGQLMQQTGTERVFYTPRLDRGAIYPYTLRATWMENGQEVSREKKLDVMIGQTYVINFAERDAATAPSAGAPLAMPSATMTGEFVRIDGEHVVFLENGGKERSFRLAPNGRLTVGGAASNTQALKPGMRVTVTTQPNSTSLATVIEAMPN